MTIHSITKSSVRPPRPGAGVQPADGFRPFHSPPAARRPWLGGVCQHACRVHPQDRKSTRLNSSHSQISYAVFCLKKKKKKKDNIINIIYINMQTETEIDCRSVTTDDE